MSWVRYYLSIPGCPIYYNGGVDRLVFLASLSKYGVPAINIKDEEVGLEIESARRLAKL